MKKPIFETITEALENTIEAGSELLYDVAIFPLAKTIYIVTHNIPVIGVLITRGIDIILNKLCEDWPVRFKGGEKDESNVRMG